MPFDDSIELKAKSPYEALGFGFDAKKRTYYSQEYGLNMAIHKPEWDAAAKDMPD